MEQLLLVAVYSGSYSHSYRPKSMAEAIDLINFDIDILTAKGDSGIQRPDPNSEIGDSERFTFSTGNFQWNVEVEHIPSPEIAVIISGGCLMGVQASHKVGVTLVDLDDIREGGAENPLNPNDDEDFDICNFDWDAYGMPVAAW